MPNTYNNVPRIPATTSLLDVALGRGRKATMSIGNVTDRYLRDSLKEKERIGAIAKSLIASLENVHDAFPSFDHMSEFMRELLGFDIDVGKTREALGAITGTLPTIRSLAKQHRDMIGHRHGSATSVTRSFLGRIASVLRKTQPHFDVLTKARDALRALPAIDDTLFTIAIAGFPNVGKSTLLRKMTGAKANVQPYAFTTKGLNVGYIEYKYNKLQCIDTPGTLGREKINPIERKATVTLRYLANVIVYVFDPKEAGAPFNDQAKLYKSLLELDKPILIYISKTDIASEKEIKRVQDHYKETFTDPLLLKKAIIKEFRAWV